jgi:hypothetical protein
LSTLLYSSETWTAYAAQEKRLNSFHLRCLRHILGIRWQDRIPNTDVLERRTTHHLHLTELASSPLTGPCSQNGG